MTVTGVSPDQERAGTAGWPPAGGTAVERSLRGIGASYLVVCLLVIVNSALHEKGLPSLANDRASGAFPLGDTALTLTAVLAVVVLALALIGRVPNRTQWVLVVLVALWAASPWLSAGLQDGRWRGSLMAMAISTTGVALAAALAGPVVVRWVFFVAGAAWAGASLVLGGIATASEAAILPAVRATDGADRFTQWVQALGFDVPPGSVMALEGLSLHRNLLGMSMAVLLVLQVRHVLTVESSRRVRALLVVVGPGLTATTLVWTMSRTSILAGAVGLLVSLVPIERVRRHPALIAVGFVTVAIAIAPLLVRNHLAATLEPGTLRWRAMLWQELLAEPGVWRPLGLGPGFGLPLDALHSHNQALDTLVNGGWLGAVSLLCLTVLGTVVAARVADLDRRAAFSCIITGALVSQAEPIASTKHMLELNMASVVVIAVVVSAAHLLDGPRQARRPPSHRDPAEGRIDSV